MEIKIEAQEIKFCRSVFYFCNKSFLKNIFGFVFPEGFSCVPFKTKCTKTWASLCYLEFYCAFDISVQNRMICEDIRSLRYFRGRYANILGNGESDIK